MNYNYVLFFPNIDYYRFAFSDIIGKDNVRYVDNLPTVYQLYIKLINRIPLLNQIKEYISFQFFRFGLNELFFSNDFNERKNIIFIFHASFYQMRLIKYFEFLKKKYPNSKCVFFFTDTVKSYETNFKDKFADGFNIGYLKKICDLILTYNKLDAEKYGFNFYNSPYSNIHLTADIICPENDVFFVGRAKDRLSDIHNAYKCLVNNGFKCDFYIVGVNDDDKLKNSDIHYNTYLKYSEVISHVLNSKGIMEIVQKNTLGFTFRLHEALIFNKNIITDNEIINEIPYINSGKIFNVSNINNLNKSDYCHAYNKDYMYKNDYSPEHLLRYLDNIL